MHMTETQRTWFIRLGILAGIIIALFLLISVIRNVGGKNAEPLVIPSEVPSTTTETVSPGVSSPIVIPTTSSTVVTSPTDRYLVQLSRIVIERLGSFSNQNENAHVDDVLPLVTERMARYIETLRQTQSNTYRGQTTRVVTIQLQKKETGKATVVANVQRESDTATSSSRTYPVVRVELVEISPNQWRVDGIFWE